MTLNQNLPLLAFYHADCIDGSASAAILKKKYPQIELFPVRHDGQLPTVDLKNKILFIVDFSFSADVMKSFKSQAAQVYWYDHHKTALNIQKELGWGILDLEESGASLTWKQEFPTLPLPPVIAYVKDKDLWQWKLPYSREMSLLLKEYEGIHEPSAEPWQKLLSFNQTECEALLPSAQVLAASLKRRLKEATQKGFEVHFHGHRALALNWSQESSEMGEYIYRDLAYPVALMFYYSGKSWVFSLRSASVDVSELAQKYGGGGHPGASGFRSESIDWLFNLKSV